jgi:hypothetical protein
MTDQRKCIFCDEDLNDETRPEHVLQAALGGRLETRDVICTKHNEQFGGTIDRVFAEEVATIRNLLQLESGTGKSPPKLRNVETDKETINFLPDGTPELVTKPFTVTTNPDGMQEIRVTVNRREDLPKLIPHLAGVLRCSEEEVRQVLAAGQTSINWTWPGTVHHQLSFGGPQSLRSIAKSCLVLWTLQVGNEEVKSRAFDEARHFVLEGSVTFNTERIRLDSRSIPSVDRLIAKFGQFFNLIYVSSDERGRVVAHFTLYNIVGWQLVLAETGGSPNQIIALCSNPLSPKEWSHKIAQEITIPFSWLATPAFSFDHVCERMHPVGKHHVDATRSREMEKIVEQVFEKNGIMEGRIVSDSETKERLFAEIAQRVGFLLMRLPHTESMTPVEVEKLLSDES